MTKGAAQEAVQTFKSFRRHLTGLAYRMLGALSEAEDVVQEAYLRWHGAQHATVDNPRAYLSTMVTRLCLDHLKSAQVRRETYVGPWLPEPIIDATALVPDTISEYAGDLSMALMMTLERLSAPERAAFLLHDVFDVDFSGIAEILGRSPAACRQLAARARDHIRAERPRFQPSAADKSRVADAFHHAVATGELDKFADLLAEDAVLYTDGGGKRAAALNPIYGREKIMRFFHGLQQKGKSPAAVQQLQINCMPGILMVTPEGELATLAIEMTGGMISAVYAIRNPDKLRHIFAGRLILSN